MLSIVIPTLNAAQTLEKSLLAVGAPPFSAEVIIADGGSEDATCEIALRYSARTVTSPPGRGGQLANGAAQAAGEWFLFLHADTVLAPEWKDRVAGFMTNPENKMQAAVFTLTLDDPHPAARRIERLARIRAKWLGLAYGDQGLLISRALYDAVGGFASIPLMEDVAIIRTIRKNRLHFFDVEARTDAIKYRRDGYWLRPIRNLFCLCLYFIGIPPIIIKKIYR